MQRGGRRDGRGQVLAADCAEAVELNVVGAGFLDFDEGPAPVPSRALSVLQLAGSKAVGVVAGVPRFPNDVPFADIPGDDLALDGTVPLADLAFPPALLVKFAREEGVGEETLSLPDMRAGLRVYALHGERVR